MKHSSRYAEVNVKSEKTFTFSIKIRIPAPVLQQNGTSYANSIQKLFHFQNPHLRPSPTELATVAPPLWTKETDSHKEVAEV